MVTGSGFSPIPSKPISNVTPFTYRDGATYLKLLEDFRGEINGLKRGRKEDQEHHNDTIDEFNGALGRLAKLLSEEIERVESETAAEIERVERETDEEFASVRRDTGNEFDRVETWFREIVRETHEQGVTLDPTNGTRLSSVSKVLGNTFDNLRVHAMFASDYDSLGLTAAEYDGLNLSARRYDLAPLSYINSQLGDFEGIK